MKFQLGELDRKNLTYCHVIPCIDLYFQYYLNFGAWAKDMPKPCYSKDAFWYLFRRFGAPTADFDDEKSMANYCFYNTKKDISIQIMVRATDLHITFLIDKKLWEELRNEYQKYFSEILKDVYDYSVKKYNKEVFLMSFASFSTYESRHNEEGDIEREFTNMANFEILERIFGEYCKENNIEVDNDDADAIFWGDDLSFAENNFSSYCRANFEKIATEMYGSSFEVEKIGYWYNYEPMENNKKGITKFINFFKENKDKYPNINRLFSTMTSFEKFMQKPVNVRDVSFDLWGK